LPHPRHPLGLRAVGTRHRTLRRRRRRRRRRRARRRRIWPRTLAVWLQAAAIAAAAALQELAEAPMGGLRPSWRLAAAAGNPRPSGLSSCTTCTRDPRVQGSSRVSWFSRAIEAPRSLPDPLRAPLGVGVSVGTSVASGGISVASGGTSASAPSLPGPQPAGPFVPWQSGESSSQHGARTAARSSAGRRGSSSGSDCTC